MPHTCRLPLSSGSPEQIHFPDRCICCGSSHQADSTLTVSRLVMRGQRQVPVMLRYAVPHCETCARGTKARFLAGMIPFLTGFVLLGVAAFLFITVYTTDLGVDQNIVPGRNNALVLGAAAGLVAGLVGAFLFELLARLLLHPIFGRALWQAPLLIIQFFQDADYVAGLRGRLDADATHLILTFNNDELAAEFETLNPTAQRHQR